MKKHVFSFIIIFLIVYSLFFPEITVYAARNGIQIWFHQILPALLPFTILSALLVKSDFLKSFNGNANLIACFITMSCGFVFGFPVGAKLSADFYKQKLISQKQATILAVATNNFSPMYICGFALSLLFSSKDYNIITYIILYFIPLLLTVIYLICQVSKENLSNNNPKHVYEKSDDFKFNMQTMDESILSGFEALIKICGYIMLFSIATEIFSVIISNFTTNPPLILMILLGNLEITNGINLLSEIHLEDPIKYILAIQLLSLGGMSGFAQSGSILSDAGLSMHKYIIGKASLSLLLTLLSVIYVLFIRLL